MTEQEKSIKLKSDALEQFQRDPGLFFEKILGVTTLESYQRGVLSAIVQNDRVVVSACHDVGKSWTLARIVLWFCTCFPYSKVITTAPTFNQVKNILWSEIRSAYARSKFPLGGKMNLTEWQVTKEGDWFAIGFTPRNELSGESGQGSLSSFQGFHAPYILIVFDEATGIPHNIWTMAEGMLTSGNIKFVAIGNPTSRNSQFFKCFSSPDWHKIKLSCFDSPNLSANGITDLSSLQREISRVAIMNDAEAQARLQSYRVVKSHLITLKWIVSMGLPRKWGVDHPLFVSKVLGQFPTDSDGTLIPLGYVEEATLRAVIPEASDRRCLGVDVARFGSDSSVLTGLHGLKQTHVKQFHKKDTMQLAGEVIQDARENGPYDVISVDVTGVGGGVVDALNEAKQEHGSVLFGTDIRGVQFGGACEDDEDRAKFVNLKARMLGLLRDDIKGGLALLPEDVYVDELPTILYSYNSKGQMVIESKEEYKRRTGRKSPDHTDSLALANFGRYDEIGTGKFTEAYVSQQEYVKPFAASLTGDRQW